MSDESVEKLELRALEERNRLHETAGELKEKMAETRENLSLSRQAREHFLSASVGVSVLGFLLGYRVAGMLMHDH
jgi:hypothetical protein